MTSNPFANARADLERLCSGIGYLYHDTDNNSDSSGSDCETVLSARVSSQVEPGKDDVASVSNGIHEDTEGGPESGKGKSANVDSSRMTQNSVSHSDQHRHKRQRAESSNDEGARVDFELSDKRSKPTIKRFLCCFENGHGRNCSGTDESISEVIKKLSERHNKHVCDRCWALKVTNPVPGDIVHEGGDEVWRDHCLSPQCHNTAPDIGYRHAIDQSICGTKTTRVRPRDSEAVCRFIFQLVHPALEIPEAVFTTKHSLHLDVVPRQGRRRATREELTVLAEDLSLRLEGLEEQFTGKLGQLDSLEQHLVNARHDLEKQQERNLYLEALMRRVVAILSDALRTGEYRDPSGHLNLLARVKEDAPDALSFLSQSLPTPPASANNPQSGLVSMPDETSKTDQIQTLHNAYLQVSNSDASRETHPSDGLDSRATGDVAQDVLSDQDRNNGWFDFLADSGDGSTILSHVW